MPKPLRKSIALLVSYAMAVQLLLLGLTFATRAGVDELAVVCAGHASDASSATSDDRPLPQNDQGCASCPLACAAAAPGVIPTGAKLSALLPIASQLAFALEPMHGWAPSRHQPQEARAPPLG